MNLSIAPGDYKNIFRIIPNAVRKAKFIIHIRSFTCQIEYQEFRVFDSLNDFKKNDIATDRIVNATRVQTKLPACFRY